MSFDKLKKAELLKIASDFGVDADENSTNQAIVASLLEMGVTYEMYKSFNGNKVVEDTTPEKDDTESSAKFVEEEKKVLVKMERENGTYETYGYKFTKTHPFVAVKESDADMICRKVEGFRLALPSEVQEYYR